MFQNLFNVDDLYIIVTYHLIYFMISGFNDVVSKYKICTVSDIEMNYHTFILSNPLSSSTQTVEVNHDIS